MVRKQRKWSTLQLTSVLCTCGGEAVAGVWGPLPLQQPHDDEDHQHEHEEGHGEADVEREVGGGELTASWPALPRPRVLVVDQHGQRGARHGAAGGCALG